MSQQRILEDNLTENTSERLYELLETLDDLHSAASEGRAIEFSQLDKTELTSLLREIAYIAGQTLQEIQTHSAKQKPILRLMEKIEKVG